MTKEVSIVFPHQLFLSAPHLGETDGVWLVEEHLFFKQYAFHKQKIAFHRASMKNYELQLSHQGEKVDYVESSSPYSDLRNWKEWLVKKGVTKLHLLDPCDDYLERRLLLLQEVVQLEWYDSPAFLNSKSALGSFFREDKKLFFQTSFYKQQRKNRGDRKSVV